MSLLILGGTADGRQLANQLHAQAVPIIYSVAGLVRQPDVDCETISGGFAQFGGLARFIQTHDISIILDVTHPYAKRMSDTAVSVAQQINIPCWRFCRPSWEKQAEDDWQLCSQWNALFPLLQNYQHVFLTCGQLNQQQIDDFLSYSSQQQILRTAIKPQATLPQSMTWLKAIGPFELEDELRLMQTHRVDALVSKNSGGSSTQAKLMAARELNIPVFMLERPQLMPADQHFYTHQECVENITKYFQE